MKGVLLSSPSFFELFDVFNLINFDSKILKFFFDVIFMVYPYGDQNIFTRIFYNYFTNVLNNLIVPLVFKLHNKTIFGVL